MTSRPDPTTFAVCVFTASSERVADSYRALARDVGAAIAGAGWRRVYGGGQVGLMGEVARAALAAGGGVTGIIPHSLNRREVAFDDIDDLVLCDTLAERKQLMDDRTDVYVVLPGGIGTLDELVEVLTTRSLGYHAKAIVLVDVDGYWAPLHALLDHMVDAGTLRPDVRDLVETVTDLDGMVERLSKETP